MAIVPSDPAGRDSIAAVRVARAAAPAVPGVRPDPAGSAARRRIAGIVMARAPNPRAAASDAASGSVAVLTVARTEARIAARTVARRAARTVATTARSGRVRTAHLAAASIAAGPSAERAADTSLIARLSATARRVTSARTQVMQAADRGIGRPRPGQTAIGARRDRVVRASGDPADFARRARDRAHEAAVSAETGRARTTARATTARATSARPTTALAITTRVIPIATTRLRIAVLLRRGATTRNDRPPRSDRTAGSRDDPAGPAAIAPASIDPGATRPSGPSTPTDPVSPRRICWATTKNWSPADDRSRRRSSPSGPRGACSSSPSAARHSSASSCMPRACASRSSRSRAAP